MNISSLKVERCSRLSGDKKKGVLLAVTFLVFLLLGVCQDSRVSFPIGTISLLLVLVPLPLRSHKEDGTGNVLVVYLNLPCDQF